MVSFPKGFWHMHAELNGGHWVLYAVYVPVVILYWSLGGWWVYLCVKQWSGINHCHPRVTMHVGSTCAWRAWRDRSGCIRVANRHRKQQQFWKCQSVVYSDWCALTWKLTLTLIQQVICVCLSAMVMLGADWCWCTDTDKEAHLATCYLEMPLSMPTSVSQPYSPKY